MAIVSDFTDDHASHVTGIETRKCLFSVINAAETRCRNTTIRYFQSCTVVPLYHASAHPNSLSCLFQHALQNKVTYDAKCRRFRFTDVNDVTHDQILT